MADLVYLIEDSGHLKAQTSREIVTLIYPSVPGRYLIRSCRLPPLKKTRLAPSPPVASAVNVNEISFITVREVGTLHEYSKCVELDVVFYLNPQPRLNPGEIRMARWPKTPCYQESLLALSACAR